MAKQAEVVALPMLVRYSPEPIRRAIGDLSDEGRLLAAFFD